MVMKSSWFDVGVEHWRWPSGQLVKEMMKRHLEMYITMMNCHLAGAMKSSWFDIEVEHWQWPQRQISLMN